MSAFHRAWYSWVTHNQFDQQPHRTGTCWSLMTALLMIFGMPVLVSCCCTAGASSYGALMRSRSTRYTEASDAYLALALRGAAVDGLSHVAMVAATVALLHAAAGVTHCPLSALLNSALAWRRRGRARTWAATADSCRSRRRSPRYRQRSVPRASHALPHLQSDEGPLDLPAGWKAELTAVGGVGIHVAPVLALLDATTLRAQQSAIRSMGTHAPRHAGQCAC